MVEERCGRYGVRPVVRKDRERFLHHWNFDRTPERLEMAQGGERLWITRGPYRGRRLEDGSLPLWSRRPSLGARRDRDDGPAYSARLDPVPGRASCGEHSGREGSEGVCPLGGHATSGGSWICTTPAGDEGPRIGVLEERSTRNAVPCGKSEIWPHVGMELPKRGRWGRRPEVVRGCFVGGVPGGRGAWRSIGLCSPHISNQANNSGISFRDSLSFSSRI